MQKETFFKWNRVYLLTTPILAFIIPLLKFKSVQQSIPQEYIVQLPEVVLNPGEVFIQATNNTSTLSYIELLFYVGLVLFASIFLIRIFKLFKLIGTNEIISKDFYKLVILKSKQSAFSFFNYIFINKKLLEEEQLDIIEHELIHCKQKHSLDLLFFEILKIIMWFNPLVYIYQNRITLLHEYISDAEIVKETDKKSYFNKLLSITFNVENISFINQFYKHSLIKKRIVMITKNKSQKIKQLKYLLLIPLLVGMLTYTSCIDEANDELFEMEAALNNVNSEDFKGGIYFDFEIGKTYVGNSLMIGRYLELSEYTEKEKEITEKFNNNEELLYDHVVLLDENDVRVNWFRPKSLRTESKTEYEYVEGDDVPFAIIDEVPVFPGCEGSKEELRTCLQENITMHVNRNFNAGLANDLGLTAGVKRIFVMFKIDKEGDIAEVMARAPHKSLEEEAIRVIESLPKMEPGKQKGVAVGVKYSLPIAFKVGGANASPEQSKKAKEDFINGKKAKKYVEGDDVPFAIIENVPVFPGCVGTNAELKQCLIENITEHVNKNFNSNLSKGLGLTSGVKRIFVMFIIDKEGNITDVDARAPHQSLKEEAIRVVQSLPKMEPGKYKGKAVGVKYSLPIAFKVS
ncbi:energy transducer TonB [Lutibacter sp. A64]|uniref:energy transducer TonB n=1 Tax=Lutibacter sp. A64 TaxID=2918526 RepID=UPI001F051099|nr:energy transducer TonB [Lutibacter sp. A64]UMB55418.1 energy transducer TonB [Lutibacter sp. A64]